MRKIAQQRSRRSRFLEWANLPGRGMEYFHKEFAKAMRQARTTDKAVRQLAVNVKPQLRAARSAFRRNEFSQCIPSLSSFHEVVRRIELKFTALIKEKDISHVRYFLGGLSSSQREKVFQYDPRAELKEAAQHFDLLVKEAGVLDSLKTVKDWVGDTTHNITTRPGQANFMLNHRFGESFYRTVEENTKDILKKSMEMLDVLLSVFNEMETGLSRRNLQIYLAQVEIFKQAASEYHKNYLNYDKIVVEPLRTFYKEEEAKNKQKAEQEKQERQQAEAEKERKEFEEAQRNPLVTNNPYSEHVSDMEAKDTPAISIPVERAQPAQYYKDLTESRLQTLDKPWKNKEPKRVVDYKDPADLKSLPVENNTTDSTLKNKKNSSFIEQLGKTADNNSPASLIEQIVRHAHQMEDSEQSVGLMDIAEEIAITHKLGGFFDRFKDKVRSEPKTFPDPFPSPHIPPQSRELTEEEQSLYKSNPRIKDEQLFKRKRIDLPNGEIDKYILEIPELANINADHVYLGADAFYKFRDDFALRLMDLLDIDDFTPYLPNLKLHLPSVLRNAISHIWVHSVASVDDTNGPRDKMLHGVIRIKLSDIDQRLNGTARIFAKVRFIANKRILSFKGMNVNFKLEGATKIVSPPIEHPVSKVLEEEPEDFDDGSGSHDEMDYPDE